MRKKDATEERSKNYQFILDNQNFKKNDQCFQQNYTGNEVLNEDQGLKDILIDELRELGARKKELI